MIPPLDYARPATEPNKSALLAMVCGVVSGPAGVLLSVLAGHARQLNSSAGLTLIPLFLPIAAAFVFALIVLLKLSKSASRKDNWLAMIGVIAPFTWGFLILAFSALAVM